MPKQNLKLKLIFLGIIFSAIFGLTKNASAGTAFYVDPTAGGGGDGTYASPWNSLSQVNEHSFSTGDDVYFKANTTLNVPAGEYLDVTWNGTSGDWVIIGAYYGENQFGLNGGARPIIDGQDAAPATDSYRGLIDKQNSSPQVNAYIEIKDLRLNNSGFGGITFMYCNYSRVTNCYVYRPNYGTGIEAGRSSNIIIDGNTVEKASIKSSGYSAGIAITGSGALGSSQNCQVINNIVFGGHAEGIDILQGAENAVVSGNTCYDNLSGHIYVDAARYVEISNNVMYSSATTPWSYNNNGGITVDNELSQGICYSNDVSIHDNYIAHLGGGITIGCQMPDPCTVNNIKIYNNIIADCDYNFMQWDNTSSWTGNEYYYNISYTSNNSTYSHSGSYSPPGITWGANIFDDDVSGNAADEACTVANPLVKTTGWDNLTAGAVTVSDFDLSSAGLAGRTSCFGGDTTAPGAPSGLAVE